MKKNVGVWIDHRKAVVVTLTETGEELTIIESGAEKHVHSASGSRGNNSAAPQRVAPEDTLERKFTQHLNDYYTEVIECLSGAKSILIFGPGEAKLEFKKQIKNKDMQDKIAAVEAADKMTDPQAKKHVRDFFQHAPAT